MNLFKTLSIALIGIAMIFTSCRKTETTKIKDYSYFQKSFASDQNIINMLKTLNQGKHSIDLVSKSDFFRTIDIRTTIANEFSKQKIDERVKIAMTYFEKFKLNNPEFLELDSNQKYELFKSALVSMEGFEQSSFSIKVLSSGDCMGGFNHMANVCSNNYIGGVAFSFADADPFMWAANLAFNEMAYVDCLNSAADAMDVCGSGGY